MRISLSRKMRPLLGVKLTGEIYRINAAASEFQN